MNSIGQSNHYKKTLDMKLDKNVVLYVVFLQNGRVYDVLAVTEY